MRTACTHAYSMHACVQHAHTQYAPFMQRARQHVFFCESANAAILAADYASVPSDRFGVCEFEQPDSSVDDPSRNTAAQWNLATPEWSFAFLDVNDNELEQHPDTDGTHHTPTHARAHSVRTHTRTHAGDRQAEVTTSSLCGVHVPEGSYQLRLCIELEVVRSAGT